MVNMRNGVLFWGVAAFVCLTFSCSARTFEFRAVGTKGSSSGNRNWWGMTEKAKRAFFSVRIGSATKFDDLGTMELRAATIFRSIKTKQVAVNDVTSLSFDPINTSKAIHFMVATGTAFAQTDNYFTDGAFDRGWQMAGGVIEVWQNGKMVKHWSNVAGKGGKIALTDEVKQMRVNANGRQSVEYDVFDNRTEIFPVNAKGEKVDLDEVLAEFRDNGGGERDKGDKNLQDGKDATDETGANALDPDEVVVKSFCGYVFGSRKPASAPASYIKLSKSFRHYDAIRPVYGALSDRLTAVRLRSRQNFASEESKTEAILGTVAVLEKKYGISFRKLDGGLGDFYYSFSNEHVNITVQLRSIEVVNRDVQRNERWISKKRIEESKKAIGDSNPDDSDDVL